MLVLEETFTYINAPLLVCDILRIVEIMGIVDTKHMVLLAI